MIVQLPGRAVEAPIASRPSTAEKVRQTTVHTHPVPDAQLLLAIDPRPLIIQVCRRCRETGFN